jgi:hypothetical protein
MQMKSLFKKTVWLFFLSGSLSFSALRAQTTSTPVPAAIRLDVVYFHAPNRCPTCVATENNTKNILEKHFKTQLSKGLITFSSLDLKEAKNEAMVLKYEIVFPTLLILKKQGKKELKTDFSTTAFQYAYTEPGKYEKLLLAEMRNQLNNK